MEHIYEYILPAINIFKGLCSLEKFEGKRRCALCYEKNGKRLHVCGSCHQRMCPECFCQMMDKRRCPYCRYSLVDHMTRRIKELGIDKLICKRDLTHDCFLLENALLLKKANISVQGYKVFKDKISIQSIHAGPSNERLN